MKTKTINVTYSHKEFRYLSSIKRRFGENWENTIMAAMELLREHLLAEEQFKYGERI